MDQRPFIFVKYFSVKHGFKCLKITVSFNPHTRLIRNIINLTLLMKNFRLVIYQNHQNTDRVCVFGN